PLARTRSSPSAPAPIICATLGLFACPSRAPDGPFFALSSGASALERVKTWGRRALYPSWKSSRPPCYCRKTLHRERLRSSSPDFQPGFDLSAHSDLVRAQLARILESSGFVHSERMRQFLRFVVERSLEREIGRLKESVIGVEVFGRAPDYDPKVEPIVRIEARRLREKLQEYYEKQGSQDPVVMQLPKGGYVPTFEMRPVPVAPAVLEMPRPHDAQSPVVLLRPASRTRWLVGLGLAAALCVAAAVFIARRSASTPVPRLVPLTSLPGSA